MLASTGIDRQHEQEPCRESGLVGCRGGRDRQLHAGADRWVHASQPAVSGALRRSSTVSGSIYLEEDMPFIASNGLTEAGTRKTSAAGATHLHYPNFGAAKP